MSIETWAKIIVPLISALLGGVIVALVNYLLTRAKTKAEINKLEAETERIRAETKTITRAIEGVRIEQNINNDTMKEIQKAQQETINSLVAFSMSGFIFGQLNKIFLAQRDRKPYLFDGTEVPRRELQFLQDHGYIKHVDVSKLQSGQDLAEIVRLTPAGEWYVELRNALEVNR